MVLTIICEFKSMTDTRYMSVLTGRVSPLEECSPVTLDHSYGKPWSCHTAVGGAHPVRYLFTSSFPCHDTEDIDVDGVPESRDGNVDLPPLMDETRKFVNTYLRPAPDSDGVDWEDKIPDRKEWKKLGQQRVFTRVARLLRDAFVIRQTYPNEANLRRLYLGHHALQFNQYISSYCFNNELITWLHETLIKYLDAEYLVIYLDIMQAYCEKFPEMLDRIIPPTKANEPLRQLLRCRWDPSSDILSYHRPKALPANPIFVMIRHTISDGREPHPRYEFWVKQLSLLGSVIDDPCPSLNISLSTEEAIAHLLFTYREIARSARDRNPSRPIVLVGWGLGAALACQVALFEKASAIVCLGFPLVGIDGTRGDISDPLLELRCPVLFIIGELSAMGGVSDFELFREKLRCESSLVVVGGCDFYLRMTYQKLKTENVVLQQVDRCLLDEVSEFVGNVIASYQKHQYRVRQQEAFKASNESAASVVPFDYEAYFKELEKATTTTTTRTSTSTPVSA